MNAANITHGLKLAGGNTRMWIEVLVIVIVFAIAVQWLTRRQTSLAYAGRHKRDLQWEARRGRCRIRDLKPIVRTEMRRMKCSSCSKVLERVYLFGPQQIHLLLAGRHRLHAVSSVLYGSLSRI